MNYPSQRTKVQLIETQYLAATTISLGGRFAGANNWIVDNVQDVPVGSIRESELSEAQFQAVVGTGWILADGRGIGGSTLQTVYGFATAPDLRDMFLRGKNNGRVGVFSNPDGDLALGAFQSDGMKSHAHTTTITNNLWAAWNGAYNVGGINLGMYLTHLNYYATSGGGPVVTSWFYGVADANPAVSNAHLINGAENKPVRTFMNYFLRIN